MSDKKVTIEFEAQVKDAQLSELTAKINALKVASNQTKEASEKLKKELEQTDDASEEAAAGIKKITDELDRLAVKADQDIKKLDDLRKSGQGGAGKLNAGEEAKVDTSNLDSQSKEISKLSRSLNSLGKNSELSTGKIEKAGDSIRNLSVQSGNAATNTGTLRDNLKQLGRGLADQLNSVIKKIKDVGDNSTTANKKVLGLVNKLRNLGTTQTPQLNGTVNQIEKLASAANQADSAAESLNQTVNSGARTSNAAAGGVRNLNNEVQAGAKGQRNLGYATLEASRGLEDLQYGVKGVLNNIPTLIMQLGGSAGLAGVLSLVAVGLTVLIPKIVGTKSSLDGLSDSVGDMSKIFDELGDFSQLDDDFDTFTKSIKSQSEAINANTRSFQNSIKVKQKIRDMQLEEAALIAEIKKQKIDEMNISDSEKAAKKALIDLQLLRLESDNKVKVSEEALVVLQKQDLDLRDKLTLAEKEYQKAKNSGVDKEKKGLEDRERVLTQDAKSAAEKLKDVNFGIPLFNINPLEKGAMFGLTAQEITDRSISDLNIKEKLLALQEDQEKAGDDDKAKVDTAKGLVSLAESITKSLEGKTRSKTRGEQQVLKDALLAKSFLAQQQQLEDVKRSIEKVKKTESEIRKVIDEFPELKKELETSISENNSDQDVQIEDVRSEKRKANLKKLSQTNKAIAEQKKAVEAQSPKDESDQDKLDKKDLAAAKKDEEEARRGAESQGKKILDEPLGRQFGGVLADGRVSVNERSEFVALIKKLEESIKRQKTQEKENLQRLIAAFEGQTSFANELAAKVRKLDTQGKTNR